MATANDLRDVLKFDVERIPLPGEERASDGALDVLDELADEYVSARRVLEYAHRDDRMRAARIRDILRTLQQAQGRLAVVTWGNAGITAIGYRPSDQRFDMGGYSAVRDMMGDECEVYETCTRAAVKDMLIGSTPDIVRRDEAGLLTKGGKGR